MNEGKVSGCYDYVIVGSGIAGLYTALLAKEKGSVLILTKGSIADCNTRYAQGGITAPIGEGDSPALHLQDTIAAGAGLCDPEAARILVEEATGRISDLIRLGVPFDTVNGHIALTREAAHSVARILHAGGDATGENIETTLGRRVQDAGIRIREHRLATQILVTAGNVQGIRVVNTTDGSEEEYGCRYLILATGGAGRLFKYTTNPDVATGDGIALAYLAGAEITDMEFFQFHPTALRLPGVAPFLISEAVRGEGGILRNTRHHAFMHDYAPEAELATRDVVTRSIVSEMRKTDSDHVYLDVTHLTPSLVTTRFPSIYRFCLAHGLDMTREMIPVAPAAHYLMGGIKVNVWGETSIPGLFAAGEAACTGVHGANRLASNSLLEGLVFGGRIVERTRCPAREIEDGTTAKTETCPIRKREPLSDAPPLSLPTLQSLMWDKVGIIRSRENLEQMAGVLAAWQVAMPKPVDRASYELSSLVTTGQLMTEAALLREESRGTHFRTDFPWIRPEWQRHSTFRREHEVDS